MYWTLYKWAVCVQPHSTHEAAQLMWILVHFSDKDIENYVLALLNGLERTERGFWISRNYLYWVNGPANQVVFQMVGSKEFYLYLLARNWRQLWCVFQTKPFKMTLWLFRIDCRGMKENSELGQFSMVSKPFVFEVFLLNNLNRSALKLRLSSI